MTRLERFAVCVVCIAAACVLIVCQNASAAGDSADAREQKQRKLIAVLDSGAPPQDKAMACKQLAIYGTKDAVPALAAVLSDEKLASWARIALEAIPDSAADDALRDAMGKLRGRLLVGVINSIGNRRDSGAAAGLVAKLADADPDVASAAAVALGHIGGDQAAKALEQSLAAAPDAVRPAVAEGCILCAEGLLVEGKAPDAVRMYDAVRSANVPRQSKLEAIRGAILARKNAGIPLLLEQLRSADKSVFGIGLRTARELGGREVTEALAGEMSRLAPERQAYLLLALADRNDDAVLPAVLGAAKSGPPQARIAAVGVLERLGNASCVPTLLDAAVDDSPELAKAARVTLARLRGEDVEADFLARLPAAAGKARQVLIELAGQRHIAKALPAIVTSVDDADAGVRAAAVQAIGILGSDKEAADLVRLLEKKPGPEERTNLEKALMAVSGRGGTRCVTHVLPLAGNSDGGLRIIAVHALAVAGGPDALAAVQAAINDSDTLVQDEAVRTLSNWPNNWPEDAAAAQTLLGLAKSGTKASHQVLGLRGYLQYVRGDKKSTHDDRAARVREVLPLMKRAEEKRLGIAVLGTIPTAAAIDMLVTFLDDPAAMEETCAAIVGLADAGIQGVSREQQQKALRMVIDKSNNDGTRKRARESLQKTQ